MTEGKQSIKILVDRENMNKFIYSKMNRPIRGFAKLDAMIWDKINQTKNLKCSK